VSRKQMEKPGGAAMLWKKKVWQEAGLGKDVEEVYDRGKKIRSRACCGVKGCKSLERGAEGGSRGGRCKGQ